jgi:S1-C subfamily serine protease
MPRAQLDLGGGRIVRHGELHTFEEYLPLQRAVVPVAALCDGVLTGVGTAVCIGAGWFLTAAHVVHGLQERGCEIRVILETDTPVSQDPQDVYGGAFVVRGIHIHPESDLATLSVSLPASAHDEVRKLDLRLRLPEIGEAVVAVGYPHMARDAVISMTSSASVEWERSLSAGVGVVLDHQLERLERPMRGFPGFETDAPTPPGTSGGPVLDSSMKVVGFVSSSSAPSETHDGWNSFVALLGPALELSVLDLSSDSSADPATAPEVRLVQLAVDGAIEFEAFDSFDVDRATGKVRYSSSTS